MIRVNLDKYIEKYNLNINQLSKDTGISRKALTSLANYSESDTPPVSIQYNTIEILCKYFKIGVDSLISYEYDDEDFHILPLSLSSGNSENLSVFLLLYNTVINGKEKIHYLPVTVKLTNETEPEEHIVKIPKPVWGNVDKKMKEITKEDLKSISQKHKVEFEEETILTPRFLSFSFEVVPTKYRDRLGKYLSSEPFKAFFEMNELFALNDEEVASLMKSFKRSFLAMITATFFDYLLDNQNVETNISASWNFGYYSFIHKSEFQFEYSLINSVITSLDDDDLTDPMEGFITYSDPTIEKNTYPNTFDL